LPEKSTARSDSLLVGQSGGRPGERLGEMAVASGWPAPVAGRQLRRYPMAGEAGFLRDMRDLADFVQRSTRAGKKVFFD